jgi:hypothetical protein
METASCALCQNPKATKTCGLCQAQICKSCQELPPPHAFLYLRSIPEKLDHPSYCYKCFEEHVASELAAYEVMAEKAKNVYFLTQDYRGYVRVLRRHTTRVAVEDCDDRREIILKMAYMAAELGFNSIIQSKVECSSVYNHGYESSRWRASALPALIDAEQLERSSLQRI